MEELRFDVADFTRYPLANFDNDARACYDRILISLSSLCGRKQGIGKEVIFVHAKTLWEVKFKLKTKVGILTREYSHCRKFPIHGSGQGSTNSPTIWCFVLSKLFNTHDQLANGIMFTTPDGSQKIRMNV